MGARLLVFQMLAFIRGVSAADCNVGKFEPTEGRSGGGRGPCTDCPAGKFSDGTRNLACDDCLAGTYEDSFSGNDYCRFSCAAGKSGWNGITEVTGQALEADACFNCLSGQYSTAEGEATCTDCSSGQFGNGATGSTSLSLACDISCPSRQVQQLELPARSEVLHRAHHRGEGPLLRGG